MNRREIVVRDPLTIDLGHRETVPAGLPQKEIRRKRRVRRGGFRKQSILILAVDYAGPIFLHAEPWPIVGNACQNMPPHIEDIHFAGFLIDHAAIRP